MRPVSYFRFPWTLEDRQPYLELPFPLHEYERRVGALRREMEKFELDAMLLLGDVRERGHVRWLTNFYALLGETMVVVPRAGDVTLVTSSAAHGEPMHSFVQDTWVPDLRCALFHDLPPNPPTVSGVVAGVLKEKKLTRARIGVAGWHLLSYDSFTALRAALPDVTWSDATRTCELAKACKSDLEILVIEQAQASVDAGFLAALKAAVPGATELEVCAELEGAMRRTGMQTVANLFDTRVCSGYRAALKNGNPTMKRLLKGEPIFLDISATYLGYTVDCAIGTVVGGDPTPEQENFFETASRMSEAILAAAKSGTPASSLVEVARQIAREMGEEKWFLEYISGHGIGSSQLEIPRINPNSPDILADNMVFSIEPMVVDPVRGTGCTEYMCVITPTGGRRLSRLPMRPWKEL